MSSFTLLQYQTDPPYQPTLIDDLGNPFVYTGYSPSNFTVTFQNITTGVIKAGVGTFSVDVTNNALAYQWNIADTNVAGIWNIFLDVAMLSGFERRFEDSMYIQPAVP